MTSTRSGEVGNIYNGHECPRLWSLVDFQFSQGICSTNPWVLLASGVNLGEEGRQAWKSRVTSARSSHHLHSSMGMSEVLSVGDLRSAQGVGNVWSGLRIDRGVVW